MDVELLLRLGALDTLDLVPLPLESLNLKLSCVLLLLLEL